MKKLFWLLLLLIGALPAMAFRDLETGTFISRDPAGFVDGPNLYSYVMQNPWTTFDPEGLQSANDWRREPSQMHPLPPNGYFLQYQTPGKMDGGWARAAQSGNAVPAARPPAAASSSGGVKPPAPSNAPTVPGTAPTAPGTAPSAPGSAPVAPNNVRPGTQTPGGETQRSISNNSQQQTGAGGATTGKVNYGELDSLGRPTGVNATITQDMLGTGSKASQSIIPPGFEGGAAGHARGHLLGNQLGGSGSDPRNLVTLQQNPVNSPEMRGFEGQIRMSIEGGQVFQGSFTPVYRGSNLVPRAVTIMGEGSGGFSIGVSVLNPDGL